MEFKDFLFIVLEILQKWQVIITVVCMILVIAFAKFVISYKKKPKKTKKKKVITDAAPKKPVAPPPASDEESELPSE